MTLTGIGDPAALRPGDRKLRSDPVKRLFPSTTSSQLTPCFGTHSKESAQAITGRLCVRWGTLTACRGGVDRP